MAFEFTFFGTAKTRAECLPLAHPHGLFDVFSESLRRTAMVKFDAAVNKYYNQSLADVPEIFDDTGWQELSKRACETLAEFRKERA